MADFSEIRKWALKQSGKRESIIATVPGSVHTDLLAAGKIPDLWSLRFLW